MPDTTNPPVVVDATTPYEFLARWNHDDGSFKGAHLICWRRLTVNGEIVVDAPLDPQAIDADNLARFGEVLATVNAASEATVSALQSALSDSQAQVAELTAALQSSAKSAE